MGFNFSLILVVLCATTMGIWLADYLLFSKVRQKKLSHYLAEHGFSTEDMERYTESTLVNEGLVHSETDRSQDFNVKNKELGSKHREILEKALQINHEPAPVEYSKAFFPVLFAVLIIRSFLFEPFQIPSPSMEPTLNIGDFILVNKFSYGLRLPVTGTKIIDIGEPKRGDVMVFIPPHESKHYIKRVIGLPGDHVRYTDNTVYINNEPLPQKEIEILTSMGIKRSQETIDGISHNIQNQYPKRPDDDFIWMNSDGVKQKGWLHPEGMVVPDNHYFMMGDNRDSSQDGRYWGPVPESQIIGKAVAVWMHREPGKILPVFSENRIIKNAR